jgi:hypothetical protein
VSKQEILQTSKVVYRDQEFSVIPASALTPYQMRQMLEYVKNIGDVAFIVDREFYFDEGAFFNLTMKYHEKYIII